MDDCVIESATVATQNRNCGDSEMAVSSNGEGVQVLRSARSTGEVLIGVELDLAYTSEKLLNLDVLLMHVAAMESDFEAIIGDSDNVSDDCFEKAMEFNLLSGVLDSELKELDSFMEYLGREILDTRLKISSCNHLLDAFPEMEEIFHDSEESLKRSKDQVSELRMHSDKFQGILFAYSGQENDGICIDFSESSQFSSGNTNLKMQTSEQQRHILRMLEKSLARELDLEKKLSELRQNEEMNLKLQSVEHEIFCMEEAEEIVWERLLEAENTAEVLRGILKEVLGRFDTVQSHLNGSILRESEMNSKLRESMVQLSAKESAIEKLESSSGELDSFLLNQTISLKANLKEAEDKYILANSVAFTLREKVHLLEEQLKETKVKLQNAEGSLETDLELYQELDHLKSTTRINMEKIKFLEKQLKEAYIQLQHAKALAEASREQESLLYSEIEDMKSEVLKAESRAESAEAKCIMLSETHMKLNEDRDVLRVRIESLESSLHKDDNTKVATAKDISIRTKVITDLIMQLTKERERVQKQISSLTNENKNLVKLLRTQGVPIRESNQGNEANKPSFPDNDLISTSSTKESKGEVMESSATAFQVNDSLTEEPIGVTDLEPTISANDAITEESSKSETAGTIEAGGELINSKNLMGAILALIVSLIVFYLFQQENLWQNNS